MKSETAVERGTEAVRINKSEDQAGRMGMRNEGERERERARESGGEGDATKEGGRKVERMLRKLEEGCAGLQIIRLHQQRLRLPGKNRQVKKVTGKWAPLSLRVLARPRPSSSHPSMPQFLRPGWGQAVRCRALQLPDLDWPPLGARVHVVGMSTGDGAEEGADEAGGHRLSLFVALLVS